jgi:hypothetical protein
MDGTIRVRTAAWFATAVVISVFATLLVMQEWRADAAPGDSDATWVAIEPCRLFDYRPGEEPAGGKKTPLVAGAPATQQVTGNIGNCTIPTTGVVAVSMNVTVVQGTAQSNLRLYPADAATEPVVSNLNWKAGDSATANKVDVKLSATGAVKLANFNGTVNVIGDVVGYYTNTSLKALQDEVDALEMSKADKALLPVVMYVSVTSGGSINQNIASPGVSTTRDSEGIYTITFPVNVQSCTAVAGDISFAQNRDPSPDTQIGDANQVEVRVRDSADILVDTYFDLHVVCPPGVTG